MKVKEKEKRQSVSKRLLGNKSGLELLLLQCPAIVYCIIFCYLPMIGIIVAFKDYRFNLGIFGSEWSGLKNFEFLFASNKFFTLVRNTIGYNLVFIIITNIVNICLALLLYNIKKKTSIKIIQSATFIPYFLSWIVVSYISLALLSYDTGLINKFLAMFGKAPIEFYSDPSRWPIIFLLFHLWKGCGFGLLVYYGTMLSIDTELLEAAALDGCGYLKRIWYIILPHIKGTVVILIILALGSMFHSDFGMFYYLPNNQGVLYETTDVLDTYIMRSIQETNNLSASSAASFIQSICGFVLIVTVNLIIKKIDSEKSLF